jgi:hypothetical protein
MTRFFGLDLKSPLELSASVTRINNKQDMGVAKKVNYSPFYGNVYTAPGGDFHRKYPDMWNVSPALPGMVTMWQVPAEPACMFSDRHLIRAFGKLECTAPAACASTTDICPKLRKHTKWSIEAANNLGRRLQGLEIVKTVSADKTLTQSISQFPTVAYFKTTKADGNIYITAGGQMKPRLVETITKEANGTVTTTKATLAAPITDQCTVTDKMIKETCGVEVFAPPVACAEAEITCPALPDKITAVGPMKCIWDKTTTCNDHACTGTTPCKSDVDDTCFARVLSNITAGIFGRGELTCPAGSHACSPGELSTVGIDLASGKVQPFYNQASYLTFGGKIGAGADTTKPVCTLTHAALQAKCGVQVCKTVTFKKSGAVVDCGLVSQGPTNCRREVLTNGCPSNTCVDLHTSSCFDANKDLVVDEQDAIILFTAGNVPKDFGGVELLEKYLKRDGVTSSDSAAKMHARVQQCRKAKQYSFTSGFKQATDRFDFVALYIAVTVSKSFGGQSLLESKIKSSFGITDDVDAGAKYDATVAAIKSKHITLAA